MKYFLSLAILAMTLVSPAHATSVVYQDRDRAVAVEDGYGPNYYGPGRPHGHAHRPYKPHGTYRPQPMRPPKAVRVGPPQCGDKWHFDQKLGICVANEVTRINMPAEHKQYLSTCPGVIKTRTIMRDGVLVEQQRCFYGG